MSGEDKAQQIGEAVQEYQTAKIEVAHLEKRIETAFQVYRDIGNTMERGRGTIQEPTIENGILKFGYYMRIPPSPRDLLTWDELTALVTERDQIRKRKNNAKNLMTSLGIAGVD